MEQIISILIAVAFCVAILSILHNLLWVKIETTAKPLVGGIIIIATLYVGYDLLITVFSYGTWAVFFKKLVGSIIIVLPISYILNLLEQYKKRKRIQEEKKVAYEEVDRLTSIGWNREVAIKKVFGENSQESLNNPIKQVQKNVIESSDQDEEKDLVWEYGINNLQESSTKFPINIGTDIVKSLAWYTNKPWYVKIVFAFIFIASAYAIFPYEEPKQTEVYYPAPEEAYSPAVEEAPIPEDSE